MRILSYLNLSNPSNLEADSGYVFQRTLLKEMALKHQVYLIGPDNMTDLDSCISPIYARFAETKYGVRFGFEYESLKRALFAIPACDLLLNNQTELTIPLQALCYEIWGRRIKCLSYFHYLAIQQFDEETPVYDPSLNVEGFGTAILDRQKEAFKHSHMNIIGSNFGRTLLIKALGTAFDDSRLSVIPPPAIPETSNVAVAENPLKKPVILYNHRLYGHYGGVKLFEMLDRLHKDYDFELIITDPTFRRSGDRNKLDNSVLDVRNFLVSLPFVKVGHYKSQQEYRQLMLQVDFALGPMRVGALWSMAVVDAMSMGKPVIAFNSGAFREVIQDEDLLFIDEASFRKIFIQLLTNKEYRNIKGEQARKIASLYDAVVIAHKFEEVIQLIVGDK